MVWPLIRLTTHLMAITETFNRWLTVGPWWYHYTDWCSIMFWYQYKSFYWRNIKEWRNLLVKFYVVLFVMRLGWIFFFIFLLLFYIFLLYFLPFLFCYCLIFFATARFNRKQRCAKFWTLYGRLFWPGPHLEKSSHAGPTS